MNKEVVAIRHAQWRKIIDDCINRNPKTSKRQWCKTKGISFRSLMYWQRKLQLEAIDQMRSSQSPVPIQTMPADVPVFVDVTAQVESLQENHRSNSREPEPVTLAPELMIQAGSYRIYVNSSLQEATLKKVMRVIGHA